jgi:hypothetical protein
MGGSLAPVRVAGFTWNGWQPSAVYAHRPLLLNWFRAKKQFSSGIVEGFNNKAKLTTRKAYGFRTYHAAEIALYHALGALPVPETTHEFF